ADPDCYGAPGLCDVELDCFDGLDTDQDDAIDCDDSDCAGSLGCGESGVLVLAEDFEDWDNLTWTIEDGGTPNDDNFATWSPCADIEGCTYNVIDFSTATGTFAMI